MYDSIPVKILVTAFEPFGMEMRNSSLETLRNLPKIPGMVITKLEVPVVFGTAEKTVLEKLRAGSYDAVMMLGEAGGRSAITPELKAVNLDDARIPDNAGNKPRAAKIRIDGEDSLPSNYPLMEMVLQMTRSGIPARVSADAGKFVCNHLLYQVLYDLRAQNSPVKAGFIHLPYLDIQGHEDLPSLTLDDAVKGITTCLQVLARTVERPSDPRALTIRPIAVIHTDFPSKFGIPKQSGMVEELTGTIVFEKEYRDLAAFRGLQSGFTHLWLIWGFSENEPGKWSPTVRPPRLGGNERMGVFATRSPFRPNPLGLSAVKLIRLRNTADYGPVIDVAGADLMDNTPIYDIKPYIVYADSIPEAKSGFATSRAETLEVVFPKELRGILPADKEKALIGVLAEDPRPHYQHDPKRIYGFPFAGHEIHFRAEEDRIILTGIECIKEE